MAVRICYLSRGTLGASLRSLRLVGHGADESWPDGAQAPDVDAGAAWIRSRLSALRSTNSLALLCMDVEGGVCSWLSAPSGSPAVVAALARGSLLQEGDAPARAGTSAVDFYAGDSFTSTIQSLDGSPAQAGADHKRLPILAISDVPARLLMDSLDRVNISVEAAATIWHVMAHAWDPGAPRVGAPLASAMQASDAADAPITGVVLVDAENARLLWTWSRAGRLVVAGSMRLRKTQQDSTAIVEAGDEASAALGVSFGQDDVSRLTIEWLSWAAQVGHAPSRFVCVLPDQTQAAAFGRALGQAWTGSTVDIAVKPDPIGETLARTVTVLENTPKASEDDPQLSLVELSSRPGRSHRQLYMWWSGAITAAAVVMGILGYQMNASSDQAKAAASQWEQQQDKAIKQVLPDARPGPGRSIFDELKTEVSKRRKETQAVKRGTSDIAMPVFEELETLSFVVGNNGFELDSIDLDSQRSPRFTVITPTTRDAEDLLVAIKRVSGSNITDWTTQLSSVQQGDVTKVRGTYTGQWIKPKDGGPR